MDFQSKLLGRYTDVIETLASSDYKELSKKLKDFANIVLIDIVEIGCYNPKIEEWYSENFKQFYSILKSTIRKAKRFEEGEEIDIKKALENLWVAAKDLEKHFYFYNALGKRGKIRAENEP
ncbi:hypothetical protein DRJ22_00710 [Candidatus Woesearchaeota archaeon]|nr:MAG: hypothetical protein B6U93_02235 [Candidatus Woesearchaeota archaeon ex4484_78]RLE46882.1 MAG: hypothetical protein DRJ22_00710 [Candidatus Woesearchaeota archaeon]